MAKVKILACDGNHAEGLIPAVGRIGVQRADTQAAWRDYCEGCLLKAIDSLPHGEVSGATSLNGIERKIKWRRKPEEMRVMRERAVKMLKSGVWAGPELCKELRITRAQLERTFRQIRGVRRIGKRNLMRYTTKKGVV